MLLAVKALFASISSLLRGGVSSMRKIVSPWAVGAIVLIVALAASSVYFFSLWRQANKMLANPTEVVRREAQAIVAKVGYLMELPAGEEPTVATITDASRVRTQAFFAKAKNGDRVLFYNQERLVILYDPVANKIVNVGSVTSASTSAQMLESPMFNIAR